MSSADSTAPFFFQLPKEISTIVFSLLDAAGICHASQVCRSWLQKVNEDNLWRNQTLRLVNFHTYLRDCDIQTALESEEYSSQPKKVIIDAILDRYKALSQQGTLVHMEENPNVLFRSELPPDRRIQWITTRFSENSRVPRWIDAWKVVRIVLDELQYYLLRHKSGLLCHVLWILHNGDAEMVETVFKASCLKLEISDLLDDKISLKNAGSLMPYIRERWLLHGNRQNSIIKLLRQWGDPIVLPTLLDGEDNEYNPDWWNSGMWARETTLALISKVGVHQTLQFLCQFATSSPNNTGSIDLVAENLLAQPDSPAWVKHATILAMALEKRFEKLILLAPSIHRAGFIALWRRILVGEMTPELEQLLRSFICDTSLDVEIRLQTILCLQWSECNIGDEIINVLEAMESFPLQLEGGPIPARVRNAILAYWCHGSEPLCTSDTDTRLLVEAQWLQPCSNQYDARDTVVVNGVRVDGPIMLWEQVGTANGSYHIYKVFCDPTLADSLSSITPATSPDAIPYTSVRLLVHQSRTVAKLQVIQGVSLPDELDGVLLQCESYEEVQQWSSEAPLPSLQQGIQALEQFATETLGLEILRNLEDYGGKQYFNGLFVRDFGASAVLTVDEVLFYC